MFGVICVSVDNLLWNTDLFVEIYVPHLIRNSIKTLICNFSSEWSKKYNIPYKYQFMRTSKTKLAYCNCKFLITKPVRRQRNSGKYFLITVWLTHVLNILSNSISSSLITRKAYELFIPSFYNTDFHSF